MLYHLVFLHLLLTFSFPFISPATASFLIPPSSLHLHAPQSVCYNDGKTPAGSFFPTRSLPRDTYPLAPRVKRAFEFPIPCTWCAPGSHIFLQINSLIPNAAGVPELQGAQTQLLKAALNAVSATITQHGDGLVPAGVFDLADYGFRWYSKNANNHQQTWGVLQASIAALLSFYIKNEVWGAVTFSVYDQLHAVAEGAFEPL